MRCMRCMRASCTTACGPAAPPTHARQEHHQLPLLQLVQHCGIDRANEHHPILPVVLPWHCKQYYPSNARRAIGWHCQQCYPSATRVPPEYHPRTARALPEHYLSTLVACCVHHPTNLGVCIDQRRLGRPTVPEEVAVHRVVLVLPVRYCCHWGGTRSSYRT